MLDSFNLHKLHSTYCMSLYGCELFNYNSKYFSELYVAWRKVIRKIVKLPMRTHNYIVCGIVESVNIILDRRIAKYIFNVINSNNITVTSLINTFLNCESSQSLYLQKIIDISCSSITYHQHCGVVTSKHLFQIFHT